MEALIAMAERLLSSQSIVQVLAGSCTFLLIGYMVVRARADREHMPPPAGAPAIEGPGLNALLDLVREQRDLDRRRTEDCGQIRDCVRILRDDARRHTELLQEIAEDQRVEHRLNAERERRHL